MGLSATEITNSTAGQFDVELRFYAGLTYSSLTLASYISGAIDPSTSGWTNITSRVTDAGSLTYERSGNSLRFTTQLSGTSYDATYCGPGQAILCLRRILVAGAQTVPASGTWELWWLGQITAGGARDDYQHGGQWTRSLGGVDTQLQRATAPRLTAGRLNLLSNASVTASSTLSNPALEASSGEFAGTLVSVAAANTIDGNLNTLWISNDAPSSTASAEPAGWINKAFFKPLTGYSQSKLWWLEFWCPTNENLNGEWSLTNKAGQIFIIKGGEDGGFEWAYHKRAIVCASRADWEAYTGGGGGIDQVREVKTSGQTFTLSPTDDWVQLKRGTDVRAALAWNQNGATVTITGWSGAAKDVSDDLCPPGSGLQLLGGQDGGTAAEYAITDLLIPGDDFSEDAPEWLQYTLEARSNALAGNVSAGATTVTLNTTLGMLDAGAAICETDAFAYTGRTSTTLTGVTGIGAHSTGAAVHQVVGGITQYGWPCAQLDLLRPRNTALPRIAKGRIYFLSSSLSAPGTPDDANWELDYDGSVLDIHAIDGLADTYNYVYILGGPTGGNPRWVQYVLIVFDDMTPAAERARLNEARLWLAQTQIDNSGLGDLGNITACGLAQYIIGLSPSTTGIARGTSLDFGPFIGEHATAVAPYPSVLDDLARVTGCVMDWDLAGTPTWWPDMWWPLYTADSQATVRAALDATYLRGQVQYSGRQPNETGVSIHARTPDGLNQFEAFFPPSLTTEPAIAYDDLVVTSANAAALLAQSLYYKAGLQYTAGPQEMTFTLKGPGEWLRPEQWLTLACHNSTGETLIVAGHSGSYDTVSWLTESVTWTWGRNGAFRTWAATVKCRRYWR
jgi:hypothetical protein